MWRILLLTLSLASLAAPLRAEESPANVAGAMTVNVLQARQLYDMGAVFIDVRPAREWSWGHVQGAVHLDLQERFAGLAQQKWPRNVPVVIYADSELGPEGALAAALAVEWGYRQVFYFRSGYFAWQLFDFPLGRGLDGEVVAGNP